MSEKSDNLIGFSCQCGKKYKADSGLCGKQIVIPTAKTEAQSAAPASGASSDSPESGKAGFPAGPDGAGVDLSDQESHVLGLAWGFGAVAFVLLSSASILLLIPFGLTGYVIGNCVGWGLQRMPVSSRLKKGLRAFLAAGGLLVEVMLSKHM